MTCVHDEARIYRGTHNVLDFRDDYRIDYSDCFLNLWFHAAKTFFLPTYLTLFRPDTKIQRSICLSKVFLSSLNSHSLWETLKWIFKLR